MTTIALAKSFTDALHRLDRPAMADVLDAMKKVADGLPSVHVHKLENSPFVSFSVNRDARRVICERAGDVLHLLWVDAHDDAYAWARRHRTVRVGHHVRTIGVEAEPDAPAAAPAAVAPMSGPLSAVRDRDLARFGVPPSVCAALRTLSDDGLLELAALLRPPLGEALLDLAVDPDRMSAIWLDYHNRKLAIEADTYREPTPEEALRSVVNTGQWLPTDGQAAVERALTGEFAAWRVFLHPSQARLVKQDFTGPVKLTGGPGTGKTVVALHRARHLLEAVFPSGRVLLATYNRTLARHLDASWASLCADVPAVRDRADVLTLTRVAQEVLRRAGRPHALITDAEVLDACWDEALALDVDQRGRALLASEREHVVAWSGAWSEAAYLRARRARGRARLDKPARKRVWACLAAFDAALAARGGGDAIALSRDAAACLASGAATSPWDAVVYDELQDASPDDLRLLAGLTTTDGAHRPNALFLCGDSHQRLYASPIPLTRCGIDVRGRSRVLRLNYRTTEGIRAYAVQIAHGLDPDEPDTDDEPLPVLTGYRSLRAGPPPDDLRFASREDEADWIARLDGPALVLTRTRARRDALAERLRERGQRPFVLDGDGEPAAEGLTLCTLHRAKGLEAGRVVIAGRESIPARWPGGDPSDRALWERKEASLLYVGITRARDACAVTRVAKG